MVEIGFFDKIHSLLWQVQIRTPKQSKVYVDLYSAYTLTNL